MGTEDLGMGDIGAVYEMVDVRLVYTGKVDVGMGIGDMGTVGEGMEDLGTADIRMVDI